MDRFARKVISNGIFEAYRFAVVEIKGGYRIHCDEKNCFRAGWSWTVIYNEVVEIDGKLYRFSIIGYSRRSVTNFLWKEKTFGPILADCVKFVNDNKHRLYLDPEKASGYVKPSTTELRSSVKPDDSKEIHLDKLAFYGMYAHVVNELNDYYRTHESKADVHNHPENGLLHMTGLTNNPHIFWQVSHRDHLEKTEMRRKRKVEGSRLACNATNAFRKRNNKASGLCRGRWQPHNNPKLGPTNGGTKEKDGGTNEKGGKKKKAGVDVVQKEAAVPPDKEEDYVESQRMLAEIRPLAWEGASGKPIAKVRASYRATLKSLSSKSARGGIRRGLFHSGEFVSQHVLQIGSLCGYFPKEYLACSRIAVGSGSWKKILACYPYLKKVPWDLVNHVLIGSISFLYRVTHSEAENIWCVSKATTRWAMCNK